MAKDTVPDTENDGLTLVEDLPLDTDLPGNGDEVPELATGMEYKDPGPFATEQSEFQTTPEQRRRDSATTLTKGKGGSKNKAGMPPNIGAPQVLTSIPRPHSPVYKSDATNPTQRSKAAWTYWASLPSWAQGRTMAYVYRDWPPLKPVLDDNEAEFAYIDKISGNEPLQDDMDLLKRYGCGSYRVIFNEQPGKTLFTAYVYNLGGTDLKSFPPSDRRVSDIEQVDLDRKECQSYKDHLRMRGLLPEQNIGKIKESEMATVDAVKEMANSTERMANKMVEMAEKRNDGSNLTGEMIRESIKTANDITKNAVEHAFKVQEREAIVSPSQGPSFTEMFEMVSNLMTTVLAKANAGGGGADPAVLQELAAMRATVTEMQNQRIRALEEEVRIARTNPQPQPVANTGPGTLREQIQFMKELKEFMDDMNPSKEENPIAEVIKDNSPPWMKVAMQFAPVFANVLAARMGTPPMPGQPQPNPQAPSQQQLQLVQPQPPTPVQQQSPQDEMTGVLNVVAMPLLNYLADDVPGSEFAEWVISGYNEATFDEVKKHGTPFLVAAIKSHAITGPNLATIKVDDAKLEKFVNEFVTYKLPDDSVDMTTDVAISPGPVGA